MIDTTTALAPLKAPDLTDFTLSRAGAVSAESTVTSATDPSVDEDGPSRLLKDATKLARHAVKDMRKAVQRSLREIGLGGDFAAKAARALVSPVLDALKAGGDVDASLSFAAASAQTVRTSAGTVSSLTVIARSIDIEIDHDAGTVSVAVASARLVSTTASAYDGSGAAVGGAVSADALAALLEASDGEAIPEFESLGAARPEVEAPEIEAPEIEAAKIEGPKIEGPEIEEPEVEGSETAVPTGAAPDGEAPESAGTVSATTAVTVRAIEEVESDAGQRLTRLSLDVTTAVELAYARETDAALVRDLVA